MSHKIRHSIVIVGCLALFGVGGLLLERIAGISPERLPIGREAGPAGTSAGRLGRIASQLEIDSRTLNSLLLAGSEFPSSLVMDAHSLDPNWAVLSIVADVPDLNDPEKGILANPHERGREWERLAFASYYDQDELIFATRAGLRRHGGASRGVERKPSLRLYFRDEYGSKYSGQDVFEDLESPPARIVVRRTAPFFATTFSFEIARQIGAPTPAFKLAQLVLNGELEGSYLLTEHVHPDGWGRSRFGHTRLSMIMFRGTVPTDQSSLEKLAELATWVHDPQVPVSMETLGASIDLDNMFRNIFTIIYCGTGDWAQGAIVRDESPGEGRWFWLHWDLDLSFRGRAELMESKSTVQLMLDPVLSSARRDLRSELFRRLLAEDLSFRILFTRLAMDLLNHRLDAEFLNSLLARYDFALTERHKREYRRFFRRRAEVVRADMQAFLGAGPAHQVLVEAPDGLTLEIDGYPEEGGYAGVYFEGTEITLETAAEQAPDAFYWLVNGERHDERRLVRPVDRTMTIEAVVDRDPLRGPL